MSPFAEIRRTAWERLFANHAFWLKRIVGVNFCFAAIYVAVLYALRMAYNYLGLMTLSDYRQLEKLAQTDVSVVVPELTDALRRSIFCASGFELFVTMVMSGIVAYAFTTIVLRAADNQKDGGSVFGGVARPFSVSWLSFRIFVQILGWTLLFVIPGIIAAYRYAMAWMVKAENPNASAAECIEASKRLMDGNKRRLFQLHVSYWMFATIMLMILLAIMAIIGGVFLCYSSAEAIPLSLMLLPFVFWLAAIFMALFANAYIGLGNVLFYRELVPRKEGETVNQEE